MHLNSIPPSLTHCSVDSTEALFPFPLDFLDTEMRLEMELCIFHETVNASALAAPPQPAPCIAPSIPIGFYDLAAYFWRSKQAQWVII